jgi:hypothetical protein
MQDLTARQSQVLDLIRRHILDTGYPPTRADIANELGFKSPNAAEEHLKALAPQRRHRDDSRHVSRHPPAGAGWIANRRTGCRRQSDPRAGAHRRRLRSAPGVSSALAPTIC